MLFRYSMTITQQLMPIYDSTMHKNKTTIALNVAKTVGAMKHNTRAVANCV